MAPGTRVVCPATNQSGVIEAVNPQQQPVPGYSLVRLDSGDLKWLYTKALQPAS
jgi:hypothetical protein